MKRLVCVFGVYLLINSSQAVAGCCHHSCYDHSEISVEIGGGYRRDRLSWTQEIVPGFIDTESRNSWRDIQSYQVVGTARWTTPDHIYFRVTGDYGKISHGNFRERLDVGDDPSFPIIIDHADSDHGEVFDVSGGIGYNYMFAGNRVSIAPIIGFSHHQQHLIMDDFFRSLDLIGTRGPLPGVHSKFHTKWSSPWIGADFTFKMTCSLWLYGSGEFHWDVRYKAKGDFEQRLIHDFNQGGWGRGYVAMLGLAYRPCDTWSVNISANWQYFRVRDAHQDEDLFGFPIHTEVEHVRWHSWSAMATLQYYF